MKIEKPLRNFILIDLIEPDEGSILVLPEAVKQGLALKYARVVMTHEKYVSLQGEVMECPVEVGDIVMFLAMLASPIFVKHEDKEFVLIPSNAVAAVVSDVKEKPSNVELLS